MKKEFYLYTGVFVVCAALALWVSQPSKDKDPERVSIFSIPPAQVGTLSFSSSEIKMSASKSSDGKWWIETTKGTVKDRFLAQNGGFRF